MTQDEALNKVRKLLALAKSDNPHEAANAAAAAQAIMDKFALDSALLELSNPAEQPTEPVQKFESALNPGDSKVATWKVRLASGISRANGCRILLYGPNIRVVGRASDAETVRYFYSYLSNAIDYIAKRDCKGEGRSYALNFRIGAVETVTERLREQHMETQTKLLEDAEAEALDAANASGVIDPALAASTAIVLVKQALAKVETRGDDTDAWIKANVKLSSGRGSSYQHNSSARAHGQAAGRTISLARSKGALGS